MSTTFAEPITAPQRKFIASLLKDREAPSELAMKAALAGTKKEASNMIGELKALPYKGAGKKVETKPGYYVLEDTYAGQGQVVFQVVLSKTGNPYAKKLVSTTDSKGKPKGRWEYVPGAVRDFADLSPLTAAEAGVISKAVGYCCICGRTLTAKQSVSAGIGPICSSKAF